MSQSNQTTVNPLFYEQTAREEGWKRCGECRVEELDCLDDAIIDSIVLRREPPFVNVESGECANAFDWVELCEQQSIPVFGESWRIPADASDECASLVRALREFVRNYLGKEELTYYCGTTFRTPAHQAKFENVHPPSITVAAVIYDGGTLAPFFNLSYEDYDAYDAMDKFLASQGFWREAYAHWWSWIYRKEGA